MFDFTRFELIASSRCFPGTSSRASSSSLPLAAKIKTKQNKTKQNKNAVKEETPKKKRVANEGGKADASERE